MNLIRVSALAISLIFYFLNQKEFHKIYCNFDQKKIEGSLVVV